MNFLESFLDRNKNRTVGLDIMRAIAILLVVYVHGNSFLPEELRPPYIRARVIRISGVSIFFSLSGFLIGSILIRLIRKSNFDFSDLRNFWIRRWFRTLPNYFLVLLLLILSTIILDRPWSGLNLGYFVFLQNFVSPHPLFFAEAWSLSIEEWFYLIFPFCCFILIRISKKKESSLLTSILLFLIVPFVLRVIKHEMGVKVDQFDLEFRKIVVLRLDSIMFGVFGAYLSLTFQNIWKKSKYILLFIGVAIVLSYLQFPRWRLVYKPLFFTFDSIAIFCFLPFLSQLKTTGLKLLDSAFIFVSLISYSMYMLHRSVVRDIIIPGLNKGFGRDEMPLIESASLNFILYWALTIFCSYLLYRYFEKPFTQLRERFSSKES